MISAIRLLVIPFVLVALAMVLLVPSARIRTLLALEQVALLALILLPGLEGGFLQLYKGARCSLHAGRGVNRRRSWRSSWIRRSWRLCRGRWPNASTTPMRGAVEPVAHEARSYMEHTDKRFDLIYLPSVGGYPQMMLEPGNMIRTIDASETLANRLTGQGVRYPKVLDPKVVLTEQYLRTLLSPELAMEAHAHTNNEEFLILAAPRGGSLPDIGELTAFFLAPPSPSSPFSPDLMAVPVEIRQGVDKAFFRAMMDDQPFLAGNVHNIFSTQQVGVLFTLVGGLLALLAGLLLGVVRRPGDPKIPGRSFTAVILISLLVGANFLVMEHHLILSLPGLVCLS